MAAYLGCVRANISKLLRHVHVDFLLLFIVFPQHFCHFCLCVLFSVCSYFYIDV